MAIASARGNPPKHPGRGLPAHLTPGNPGNSGGKKGRSGRPKRSRNGPHAAEDYEAEEERDIERCRAIARGLADRVLAVLKEKEQAAADRGEPFDDEAARLLRKRGFPAPKNPQSGGQHS